MARLFAGRARAFGAVGLLVVLVVGAVTSLAYYSYRYAEQLSRAGLGNLVAANRALAEIQVSRIEETLLEAEQNVFNSIDVGNLRDPNRLKDVVRLSPAIETVIVLDDKGRIVPDGQYSNRGAREMTVFRRRFEEEMVPALDLATIPRDEHRHLHREFGGRYYLLSATRRVVEGRTLYVVLELDLAYLVGELLPVYFEGVDPERLYQILDERDVLVFGYPFTDVAPDVTVALRFPTTLRGWVLRMAPREVPSLLREQSSLRPFDLALIGLSALTIFVGLGVLIAAVRAERQANRTKTEFVANVSHELKTPLSLIKMFGELLASGRAKSPDSAREYAEIIARESDRLSTLIDNVLDFSRLERGKLAYDFTEADLGEVVERSLEAYRTLAEREGVRLEVQIAPGLPKVAMDEDAMGLVVMNLVDNALKYAQDGKEIMIVVAHDRREVRLEVRDRGRGIPRDEQALVWDRFYRGRDARSQPVRGSGIGLSLVRSIARAHGGGVEVTSTPGQGSTFVVRLPVRGVA